MVVVRGDGSVPCDIMFVGERPGWQEAEEGFPFVGDAGQELWARLWLTCHLTREDVYVTNLVKTFSKDPPSPAEVEYWGPYLQAELLKVSPRVIVTIGYHAARYLLPQFKDTNGDYFHGLPHGFEYGRLRRRSAVVVPVVHSSAALRQPGLYQNQFTSDLHAVGVAVQTLWRTQSLPAVHRARVVVPYQVGLAAFGREGQILGFDSEYNTTTRDVECVTLSATGRESVCCEIEGNAPPKFLKAALLTPNVTLVSHMAKAEYHSASRLGVDLMGVDGTTPTRVDDTMLMAYLLQLPQSLKVLSYRLLGYQMQEYEDLVDPLDVILVRKTLGEFYAAHKAQLDRRKKAAKAGSARRKNHDRKPAHDQADDRARHRAPRSDAGRDPGRRAAGDPGEGAGAGAAHSHAARGAGADATDTAPVVTSRALASIHGILTKDTADSPRQRWQKSTFHSLILLPPSPSWRDVPPEIRRPYAMTDAIAHRHVRAILWPQILEQGLRPMYEMDRAVLPMLVRNEQVGLACDVEALGRCSRLFEQQFQRIGERINRLAGHTVNPLSGDQVSECLFRELGLTPTKRTKSGKTFTTEDKYLKARKHEHKIVPLIILARQINKLRGTYADRLPGLLRVADDGVARYHPDWKYTRTPSGRLAEEIIVLIPKHTKRGLMIRNAFHATPGHRLVSVDLSQIELRCMAHLSKDEHLLRAYARGEDLHAQVAHELLGAPKGKENQDESKHRLPAKTLNFGIINGMTEFGVLDQLHEAGQLHWDVEQVRAMLQGWFRIHSGVQAFWDGQCAFARRHGYIKDLFGRRRYLWALHSTNDKVRREAERQALGAIQSTADGISKVWNKRIWRDIILPRLAAGKRYCEFWVRVHDDTTLEVDKRIARTVAQEMLVRVPDLLRIPTTAEAKVGRRWGSLHK